MPSLHRFEDLLPSWREAVKPSFQKHLDSLIGVSSKNSTHVELAIRQAAARETVCRALVSDCLDWLCKKGHWHEKVTDRDLVQRELSGATLALSAWPHPPQLEEAYEISPAAWALPAAIGAAVGSLLLSPLTWLSLDDRRVGLFLGGILGAYGLVRVLALVSTSSKLQEALRVALGIAGAASFVGAVWSSLRGKSTSWFRASLYFVAAWLVLGLTKPHRRIFSSEQTDFRRRGDAEHWLCHVGDLVLALCWHHPDRFSPGELRQSESHQSLSGSLATSLSDIYIALNRGERLDDSQELLESLFQRFEEAGYEWRVIPCGTRFEESLRGEFDSYGLLTTGDIVRTRLAELHYQGVVVSRGELRKV